MSSEGQWLFSPVEAISPTRTKGEEWAFWMQKLNDLRNVSDKDAMKSSPRRMHAGALLSHFSHVQLFATPWTVVHQAPLSMGFSGKSTGVGCHVLLQGIFLTQYEPTRPPASPALAGRFFTTWTAWEAHQDSCWGTMGNNVIPWFKAPCFIIGS